MIGDEKAKSSTSKSATVHKPNSGTTVENSASKETDAASKQPKSTTAPADPPTKSKKARSTTALANPPKQPIAVKSDNKLEQQQKVEKSTKSSKSDPRGFVWNRANTKFKFGERFLS